MGHMCRIACGEVAQRKRTSGVSWRLGPTSRPKLEEWTVWGRWWLQEIMPLLQGHTLIDGVGRAGLG
jgi:hypothetical protein